MNHGGKIALLGIPPAHMAIDWNQVIFKGLEIKGVYGREMFETWYKMVAMLQSGLDLTPMITHRYAVDDYENRRSRPMLSGQSGKVDPRLGRPHRDVRAANDLADSNPARLCCTAVKWPPHELPIADRCHVLTRGVDGRTRPGCARFPTTTRRSPIARS